MYSPLNFTFIEIKELIGFIWFAVLGVRDKGERKWAQKIFFELLFVRKLVICYRLRNRKPKTDVQKFHFVPIGKNL